MVQNLQYSGGKDLNTGRAESPFFEQGLATFFSSVDLILLSSSKEVEEGLLRPRQFLFVRGEPRNALAHFVHHVAFPCASHRRYISTKAEYF